ncbi:outer membrane N-deacetylase [Klebsiella pneumoniae]|nr:outer membrane N-deacetylase [Klebsiella pneumoniae]
MTPRERFATWEMVRELSRSPLVEIGAHTWASHYGLPANPQGSREPAAANRGWDKPPAAMKATRSLPGE